MAIRSWGQYQSSLSPEHWEELQHSLAANTTYTHLLSHAHCWVCTTAQGTIIGMAYLVPSGHPTDIYEAQWSYIRFVTVDPRYSGKGIGRRLTQMCIAQARTNQESTIALHTSVLMQNAMHIYQTLGFTILREIPPRLGKRYWLYTLEL